MKQTESLLWLRFFSDLLVADKKNESSVQQLAEIADKCLQEYLARFTIEGDLRRG